jgi:hypothetical protein
MGESLQAFRWFDKAGNWESLFSSWERSLVIYTGAFVMWMVGKKLKKRHQLKPGKSKGQSKWNFNSLVANMITN